MGKTAIAKLSHNFLLESEFKKLIISPQCLYIVESTIMFRNDVQPPCIFFSHRPCSNSSPMQCRVHWSHFCCRDCPRNDFVGIFWPFDGRKQLENWAAFPFVPVVLLRGFLCLISPARGEKPGTIWFCPIVQRLSSFGLSSIWSNLSDCPKIVLLAQFFFWSICQILGTKYHKRGQMRYRR